MSESSEPDFNAVVDALIAIDARKKAINRSYIEAQPSVRVFCGRDWMYGPRCYMIGLFWDRNFDAAEGEVIYRRGFALRWSFHVSLEMRRPKDQK